MQQVFAFVFGCIFGSFFNVVIHRVPKGESLSHPASHCPSCGTPIAFYDNIPILSYLLLRARCRHCGVRISPRYLVVELLTGLVFLFLVRRDGLEWQLAIELLFLSILILITFIDLDTYTIPDVLSVGGTVAGFLLSFVSTRVDWTGSIVGILAGGGFFYLIAFAYHAVRKQEGLGGGDIKLMAMIGAFLGWRGVIFTVLTASIVGTAVGFVVMSRKRKGMNTMLPFGPFLALGAAAFVFFGEEFFRWYMGLYLEP